MTNVGKKAAQDYFCAVSKVFDKSENRSPMVRKKKKKDHKGLRFCS
jgi:hypothetical protein